MHSVELAVGGGVIVERVVEGVLLDGVHDFVVELGRRLDLLREIQEEIGIDAVQDLLELGELRFIHGLEILDRVGAEDEIRLEHAPLLASEEETLSARVQLAVLYIVVGRQLIREIGRR